MIAWQKSSFSGSGPDNSCVEVAAVGGLALIRESDEPDTVITTPPGSLRTLIRALRAGASHAAVDVRFGGGVQGLR
ncbi:DUF397 domain-containing protein [Streptomyces rectiverticillatus]|uniref:DUF397 domain-containing protein n=1 Tax=Streptomyces rectiverticillatus TaxID=173860 RepID=UPI0015C3CB3B|nr:DUF397 domain-containing protein [Streptomyces rectiverticillatus]QLE72810.1 DUF397 domain-containing protein [Streptomyces rectiverticillatus]